MVKNSILLVMFLVAVFTAYMFFSVDNSGTAKNARPVLDNQTTDGDDIDNFEETDTNQPSETDSAKTIISSESPTTKNVQSTPVNMRQINIADEVTLPLAGSAPTKNVKFTIPVEEIRQGCFRQDCIPSVDDPRFMSVHDANDILADNEIGLALSYKGVERFYPFLMLVTHEIVNDVVASDPILVTYCPLCGTGIVFERKVDGVEQEFGVSGMLWQSNLLMYNRAKKIEDRNLWSQALGEAVVGNMAGTKLTNIPSDIVRYGDWKKEHPGGAVLDTGSTRDPYDGQYYEVARNFAPDFDASNSPLDPSEYVYGIEVGGIFKAYVKEKLPIGETKDVIDGRSIIISKTDSGEVIFMDDENGIIPDTEGFWFSWSAIHPDTQLWNGS